MTVLTLPSRRHGVASPVILLCSLLLTACQASPPDSVKQESQFAQRRAEMVDLQLAARGIRSAPVLEAMRTVPRHLFVRKDDVDRAYADRPLPIGFGQTISQPYVVAFMTEMLQLDEADRVLEIGTGSGYQAAILAEICREVYTIEIVPELGERARRQLQALEYDNIHVRIGDGYLGWPEAAPFDAVIVTCSPTHVPEPLKDQLAENGRLIIPVGDNYTQELVLLFKSEGRLLQEAVLPVIFVPMVDSTGTKY